MVFTFVHLRYSNFDNGLHKLFSKHLHYFKYIPAEKGSFFYQTLPSASPQASFYSIYL